MEIKFRPLAADEIEVKVKQVKESGIVCLLYKNARTDMDLLDETVGSANWRNDYREVKGNLYASISVNIDGHWVEKWDCGIESRADSEGNELMTLVEMLTGVSVYGHAQKCRELLHLLREKFNARKADLLSKV